MIITISSNYYTMSAWTDHYSNSTENMDPLKNQLWIMPSGFFITSVVIVSLELILSLLANITLMVTIWNSPSLKTPPNSYLVNICTNNLCLSLCMVLSLTFSFTSTNKQTTPGHAISADFLTFLTFLCYMQYLCIFSAIGYYRNKTLQKPSMSMKARKQVIRRCICMGWVVSGALALAVTLSFRTHVSVITWNPFRRCIREAEFGLLAIPNSRQVAILMMLLLGILICVGLITSSFHSIIKTLFAARPVWKNKVSPRGRSGSIESVDDDSILSRRSYYRPSFGENWSGIDRNDRVFTISKNVQDNNFIVHYQRHTQSLNLDHVYALQHPMRAHAEYQTHRQLRPTLSNSSTAAKVGATSFSDISPGAELQRFQGLKNSCALHKQSLRHDRISLSSATKNSMVMLTNFAISSLPMCLCSIPGVIPTYSIQQVSIALLFCKLIFFLNGPAYPIWYLMFSKRVRKCLHTLVDKVLIKLKLR